MRFRNYSSPDPRSAESRIYLPNGTLFSTETKSRVTNSIGSMSDDKHGRPGRRSTKFVWWGDWGGDMTLQKTTYHLPPDFRIRTPKKGLDGKHEYDGWWYPVIPEQMASPLVIPPASSLDGWGTKAVAQTVPTRPQAGLTQFVAELKDIPKLPIVGLYRAIKAGGRRKDLFRRSARHVGGEYLNYEFGWRPLVQDLIDFHKATRDASKIIAQFERDSGRVVRRRRLIHHAQSSSSTAPTTSIGSGPSTAFLKLAGSEFIRTRTDETNIWFSGAYTYYLVPGKDFVSSVRRDEQLLNKLYGTRFSVDTLWELTPWSWALDWVSSIGSVAANLAAFSNDGLIMRYGYIMFNRTITTTAQLSCTVYNTTDRLTTRATCIQELKMRRRATPFGFGLTLGALSTRQLAILSALKLSRTR